MFSRKGHTMKIFNPYSDPSTNHLLYKNNLHVEIM